MNEPRRKAKLSEIRVWYRFKPSLSIWTSDMKGESHITSLPDETWYDGYSFNSGYFAFIQCRKFAIHIMFKWWKLCLSK